MAALMYQLRSVDFFYPFSFLQTFAWTDEHGHNYCLKAAQATRAGKYSIVLCLLSIEVVVAFTNAFILVIVKHLENVLTQH